VVPPLRAALAAAEARIAQVETLLESARMAEAGALERLQVAERARSAETVSVSELDAARAECDRLQVAMTGDRRRGEDRGTDGLGGIG
jgi:hypothetical protein